MHQVMTATRAHRNANPEYHEAALDELEILNKDGQPERVKGAAIIAVGVGASEGMTRLALSKGRHVDVDRKWFMTHHPKAGAIYVQHADEKASVAEQAAQIEAAPQAEPVGEPSGAPSAADLDAAAGEQAAAEATSGDDGGSAS